jgi:hypothetical protein
MGWWIGGSIATILVLGYVAYKFPDAFDKAVASGAALVNNMINAVKGAINKQ